jgi:6-hydroxytryprostatin B O-methyltransferase
VFYLLVEYVIEYIVKVTSLSFFLTLSTLLCTLLAMTQPFSLVTLAKQILKAAEEIEIANSTEDTAKHAREKIASAAQQLRTMVVTAPELLEQHQVSYQSLSCLGWLVRFDIFSQVPTDFTAMAYTDLATRAAVPLVQLQSVARMAMTSGLFTETSPTHIAHTRLSASFATDESLRDWALFMTQYSAPMANNMALATARWGETTAKHETAFNVAFDTKLPYFDYVKATPGLADLFAGYMRSMGRSESGRLQHLVEGFDWAALPEGAIIVDVGGSTAQASIALAVAFPHLRFVVQDLAEVVAAGPRMLEHLAAADVASRITFVAHDFFEAQPGFSSDGAPRIYLLRKILHDWPAERARDILSHLARALADNEKVEARIVIMDTILPPPGTLDPVEEASLRVRDLTMAQCFNSKERELAEWEELLQGTSPVLEIASWKQPPGSAMAVIEAKLKQL